MADLNNKDPFTHELYVVHVEGTQCGNTTCPEYDIIFYDDDYGVECGFNGCNRATPCSKQLIKA